MREHRPLADLANGCCFSAPEVLDHLARLRRKLAVPGLEGGRNYSQPTGTVAEFLMRTQRPSGISFRQVSKEQAQCTPERQL